MSRAFPEVYESDESDPHSADLIASLRESLVTSSSASSGSAGAGVASTRSPYPSKSALSSSSYSSSTAASSAGGMRGEGYSTIEVVADSDDSVDDLTTGAKVGASLKAHQSGITGGDYYDEEEGLRDDAAAPLMMTEEESIETEFVTDMAQHRNARVTTVARDAVTIHSMLSQIGELVSSASTVLEDIEASLTTTRDHAIESAKETERSNAYLTQSRQRMCCLLCCLISVLVILVFVFSALNK